MDNGWLVRDVATDQYACDGLGNIIVFTDLDLALNWIIEPTIH